MRELLEKEERKRRVQGPVPQRREEAGRSIQVRK
jgi:hypothetical protein